MKEYVAKLSEGNRQTAARPNCSPTHIYRGRVSWRLGCDTSGHVITGDFRTNSEMTKPMTMSHQCNALCNQSLSLDLQIWSFPRCQDGAKTCEAGCAPACSRSICDSSRRSSCISRNGSSRSRSSTRTTTCEAAIVLLGRKSSSPPTHISPNTLSLSWGKSDFGREN